MTITETVDVTVDDIQLDLLVKPGDQADSVVDITWCISPRLRMELREQMIDDPHLLLVIVNNHEEMGRYVVPLDLGKWQIAFARGGKNTVLATVVWKNYGRQGVRRRLMRRRGSGSFNMSVIATDDPRVEMLHDQMQETQQTLDYKRGELSNLEDVIDPGAIEAPSDDADEAAQREFEIRVAIARLEADLEALRFDEGGGTPSREEQIEALRAEIATLEAEHLVLKAEYNQRSESPVREDRLLEEFDIPGNYYIDSDEAVRRSNRFGELDVEVSAQMFAKKPSKLWNWLGTYYSWPVPARDQCQMRRRVLFTLGTAWLKWLLLLVVGMLVEIVDLLLTGVLLLGGIRNINYEVLRHPLSNVPFDLLEESNRSFWFYKKSDEHWSGYERRSWALCFINPPVFLGCALLGFLGWVFFQHLTFIVIGVSLCFVLGLGSYVVEMIARSRSPRDTAADQAKRDAERAAAEEAMKIKMDRLLGTVTCGAINRPATISLPHRRKVQYLARTAKAKVCKPFAR